MIAPQTYAHWAELLDGFGKGDDTLLEPMQAGHFQVDAGTASRFYLRVEEAYKKRKQNWLEKLQRSFQQRSIRTDDELDALLRDGKQNLLPLVRFVGVQAFPDDLRKTLHDDLHCFVEEIRKSMKDHAAKSGNGKEKIILLLNRFSLPQDIISPSPVKNPDSSGNGRKIIF